MSLSGRTPAIWSQTTIAGRLRLLVVDGSSNDRGARELCSRIFNVLQRKGMSLVGGRPLKVESPQDLSGALQRQEAFNAIFLVSRGLGEQTPEALNLAGFWRWLSQSKELTSKLLAVCTGEDYDASTSRLILSASDSFAQLAIVPESPLSPRAAGLFFMKFFTELSDHAPDAITGKMVWFSRSKAQELLRRRRLPGEVGARC
jgi:hypothetical protein